MSVTKSEIRSGTYFDSVVLMQLQRNLVALPGVEDAGVVMATEANLELLADAKLLNEEAKKARPEDLFIVVRAGSQREAEVALGKVDELLKQRRSGRSQEFRPRSLAAAVKNLPQAEWVLISVPGRYAAQVTREALELDKHVFLYSDNVSLDDEVELKTFATERGLMVMGPDCGTAIINGIGFGFANRVRRGSIGIVAASGTGLQTVTTAIHNLGGGISQALGTGSRDLKADVSARSMKQGLRYIADDKDTKVIVLISKPPNEDTVATLLTEAKQITKPVVIDFIGFAAPAAQIGNLHFAAGLDQAAALAVHLSKEPIGKSEKVMQPIKGYLRGLFSGGTLAYEVLSGLQNFLHPIYSNVPIRASQRLENPLNSKTHTILDLGADEFTVGRLHPMIDNDLRLRRMKQEAADKEVGLILLDLILGEGAHPDPAAELAPAIAEHKKDRKDLEFVMLVIGTDEDPQEIKEQINKLEASGAKVFRDVSSTVDHVVTRLALPGSEAPKAISPFREPVAAINVGLESFYESLKAQGARALQVDWRPPAAGKEDLMNLLQKMKA